MTNKPTFSETLNLNERFCVSKVGEYAGRRGGLQDPHHQTSGALHRPVRRCHGRRLAVESSQLSDSPQDTPQLTQGMQMIQEVELMVGVPNFDADVNGNVLVFLFRCDSQRWLCYWSWPAN